MSYRNPAWFLPCHCGSHPAKPGPTSLHGRPPSPPRHSRPIDCATCLPIPGRTPVHLRSVNTPVDGSVLTQLSRVSAAQARAAVHAALDAHRAWANVGLAERKARVTAALDALTEHRDLLALLLVWEIGKPWRLAGADVDRALDGVRWYVARDRPADRRPRAAARPGQQHRVVELPDERARPRRAGAVAGRQRGRGQDAVAGRRRLPDAGPRADGPRGPAGHAAVRQRRRTVRGARAGAGDRRGRVRRRAVQRRQGRRRAARLRQAPLHRAGRAQRLGHLGIHPVGRRWPGT